MSQIEIEITNIQLTALALVLLKPIFVRRHEGFGKTTTMFGGTMKTIFKSALFAASLMMAAAPAMATGTATSLVTKDVTIGLNDVYVPGGFDSEADAYVVASGIFPNGCYKWKQADVKHVDTYNHEVQSVASVSQGMCIMVMIPFTKEIRLGKMASGTHNLKFINGDGTYLSKTLYVE